VHGDLSGDQIGSWGDVSDLIDILDVRPADDRAYTSTVRSSQGRSVVEGSQMLGQAIVAAGRHCPGRRAVSGHMVFVRAAEDSRPLKFALTELSNGRTFTSIRIDVVQGEKLCASGTLLLDQTTPDVIRHQAEPPPVKGPDGCEPLHMGVTGRDIRVADGAYSGDPGAPVGPPVIDAWVRFERVPEDPYVHAALLAQFTGHMSIAAALRPHRGLGQDQAHRTLSTAINAISIALHDDIHADRWMLYHHLSTFAGAGMTHSECRVTSEEGNLLASFSVDAMVRSFDDGGRGIPARAVL
jgi:acyl-CoA thioesterase